MTLDTRNYTPVEMMQGAGIIRGNGAPTGLSAAKGTLYVNLTASTTTTRLYINTNGGTTWASFTASA